MDRKARAADTVLVKTGRTQTLQWWLEGKGKDDRKQKTLAPLLLQTQDRGCRFLTFTRIEVTKPQ
jgi:hypothetical protein